MMIALHIGPKSSPKLALFDTTGIAIAHTETPVYRTKKPDSGSGAKPAPDWGRYKGNPNLYATDLAEWEAQCDRAIAAWETYRAKFEDENYRNAAIWHGPRVTFDGDGGEYDNATFVHETVEEIASLLGVSLPRTSIAAK